MKCPCGRGPFWGGFLVGLIAIFFPHILGVGYDATDASSQTTVFVDLIARAHCLKGGCDLDHIGQSIWRRRIFSLTLSWRHDRRSIWFDRRHDVSTLDLQPWFICNHRMGAVAASILGAPISTVLIAFELTGDYNVTIALLLAVAISTSLHRAFLGKSFFHWQLTTRGLFLNDGPHKYILHTLKVEQFMTPLGEDEDDFFNKEGESERPWLPISATIEQALRSFDRTGQDRIAVIDHRYPKIIVGWARKEQALHHYNQALIDIHIEQNR